MFHLVLQTKPDNESTHWSTRTVAIETGVSKATVQRWLKSFSIQPYRHEALRISTDSFFIEKARDIVKPYLNPQNNAVVLYIDEKPLRGKQLRIPSSKTFKDYVCVFLGQHTSPGLPSQPSRWRLPGFGSGPEGNRLLDSRGSVSSPAGRAGVALSASPNTPRRNNCSSTCRRWPKFVAIRPGACQRCYPLSSNPFTPALLPSGERPCQCHRAGGGWGGGVHERPGPRSLLHIDRSQTPANSPLIPLRSQ